jgi:glycosyltransferase involved in cell wall biosynthesis
MEYPTKRDFDRMVSTLRDFRSRGAQRNLWFLPSHTWFSAGFQRPQQMAIALGETGCEVVYWEPWEIHDAMRTDVSDRERRFVGLRRIAPGVWLVRCQPETYKALLAAAEPGWILFYWPYSAVDIPRNCASRVVYEMIDDHALETRNEDWDRIHSYWVSNADIVTGTADALVSQLRIHRPDAVLLPNGVRLEDWQGAGDRDVPADLAEARNKKVVVGYYGAIADWFDFDMWLAAARARPDWAFVWIGYPYGAPMEAEICEATRVANVHYLGKKPYAALPTYLRHFDVATVPFVLNAITHATSPVKLFEYMAAGKPVVATKMREILKYESVFFTDGGDNFVHSIERALASRSDPEHLRLLAADAQANTWRERALTLGKLMVAAEKRQGRGEEIAMSSSRIA